MGLLFDWLFRKPAQKQDGKPRGGIVQQDPYGAAPGATMKPKQEANVNDWFVNHRITFTPKLKPGEKIFLYWDYKEINDSMVEEVVGNCQCTAKLDHGPQGVSAQFTHQERDVPAGGKIYHKFLTVYLKDGVQKVPDGRGGMAWPANKQYRNLHFSGMLLPG